MAKYTVSKSRHDKKGIDIWLVKPTERLDMTTYKKVENQIKLIGGYYSRFVRAFVFNSEPSTEKLDEIFGDTSSISETAKQAGVSQSKVALIKLGGGNWQNVDKRTLRKEYDDRKLLVARTSYFDGMIDSTRSIPESEWDWSDRDAGFEREFTYSSKPYISGDYIKYGDYRAKYKSDIVQPVTVTSNVAKSYNYYVDIDHDNIPNEDNPFELDKIDSDRFDIEDGARVVMSLYGNKYCGKVTKKEIREYSIRNWNQATAEIKQSVYYTVLLDNGVKQSMATFKLDTGGECDEMSVPAILKDGSYKLPESFWTNDIVGYVKKINSAKKQKAARKKAEYAKQDQQWIDTYEFAFRKNAELWLGWEMNNMEYSRHITGESEEQQAFRMDKWQNELGYKPNPPVEQKVAESAPEAKTDEKVFTYDKDGNIVEAILLNKGEMSSSILINGNQTIRVNTEIFANKEDAEKRIEAEPKPDIQLINGKIPVKSIIMSIQGMSATHTFSLNDYDSANKKMRELLDTIHFSNLNYDIEFADGETLSGVIDCEPRDFFSNISNPFTRHLNLFYENVAKAKPMSFLSQEEIDEIKAVVEKYDLGQGGNQYIFTYKSKNDIQPIKILGTGSKVYYETEKLRLNDIPYGNDAGKYVLNVYDNTNMLVSRWNLLFDNLQTAMKIAEKINSIYPNGVPEALLLEKVVDEWKFDIEQGKPIHTKLRKLINLLNTL